ncbi:MAG: hypothetical protein AMJ84_00280 [Acidithiobacillales bacterium SM23_46]|nr:MAG: hypothetical protein AMJ84_00280 [Acidithiobacillales bacterium SM23_46]KPL29007.1 MAG: hypothetical protein AMJ72_00170 [Acidithiobacillales bacterium SM1_46]
MQQQPPKLEQPPIKMCPCGQFPDGLLIEMPERAKYGRAMGSCCGDWSVEFRNNYTQDPQETLTRASKAWNDAPRAPESDVFPPEPAAPPSAEPETSH